jgi:hypothetical protein
VSKEIDELVKNGDLAETTPDPYIVGYIGKVGGAKKLKAKSQQLRPFYSPYFFIKWRNER